MVPRYRTKSLFALFVAWIFFIFCHDKTVPSAPFRGERVLVLTAHPDDECMFFAPTVLSLVASSVPLFSLCLSTGNAEGIGNLRMQELGKSLRTLGIPEERSHVVDHPLLQDNFTAAWKAETIAEVVQSYVATHNITVILTFDEFGISQHPNHISLPKGVTHFLSNSTTPPAELFTLRTVPLFRKYMGFLSHPLSKLWLRLPWMTMSHQTYIAGIASYETALRAMYQHRSQLVWFRWLYVLFSRYMWVNEWDQMLLPGIK